MAEGSTGVLVPTPDAEISKYLATHPSFELVSVAPSGAAGDQAGSGASEPEILESATPDPAVDYTKLPWNELRAYASDRGISVSGKKKTQILAELAALEAHDA